MVLVDTSIWIRFLAGREPHASQLDQLLASDDVLGHDLVEGELLIGGGAQRAQLLAAYAAIQRTPTASHAEVIALVKMRKLHGRGLGWIDAHLLAAALVDRCRLWTADASLAAVAGELSVNFA